MKLRSKAKQRQAALVAKWKRLAELAPDSKSRANALETAKTIRSMQPSQISTFRTVRNSLLNLPA